MLSQPAARDWGERWRRAGIGWWRSCSVCCHRRAGVGQCKAIGRRVRMDRHRCSPPCKGGAGGGSGLAIRYPAVPSEPYCEHATHPQPLPSREGSAIGSGPPSWVMGGKIDDRLCRPAPRGERRRHRQAADGGPQAAVRGGRLPHRADVHRERERAVRPVQQPVEIGFAAFRIF